MFRENESDHFINMIIFCKKSSATPLQFREPVTADFLGSKSREAYLMPKHEISSAIFQGMEKGGRHVLRKNEIGRLHKFQDRTAIAHWHIMREVMPAKVWENW